jgi:NADH-quinone oxidoreductase subunit N
MQERFRVLALIGALNAAVAAYYYVRVIMALYLRTSLVAPAPTYGRHPAMAAAAVCAVVTVVFGLYPTPLLSAAARAVAAIGPPSP